MSGSRPALFLDRDGVINVDHGYVGNWDRCEFIPGAGEVIAAANRSGLAVVMVTNQSGIARGYFSEEDMHALHARMRQELEAIDDARFDAIYHCPYLPGAPIARYDRDSEDRKPRPGMLLRAIANLGLDPDCSFMIGDKPSDMEAATASGVTGLLFPGGNLRDFAAVHLPVLRLAAA